MSKKKVDNLETMERDQFQSRFGFILSCVGSAVGMGNIWLFPYRMGEMGGAAFLIPYIIFVVVIGFTGVIGEMAFGRAMRAGPLGAFGKAFERRDKNYGSAIGMIPVLGSLAIGIGYSVVTAWILRFLIGALSGSLISSPDSVEYFGGLATSFGSVPWHLAVIVILTAMLSMGVSDGIERINTVMMPAFFILFAILAVRVFFLDGVTEGYRYMFIPKWSLLKDPKTWVFALGQAFFSLSLAGSGTLVYGSYLDDEEDVIDSARYVVLFDCLAAILAALVIIPSVFAYDLDIAAGPPLMFITLPEVFKQMPFGRFFSIIFFIAVFFAAITSLMNLLESAIEALQSQFKMSRFASTASVMGLTAVVGTFIQDGDVVGAWMDVVSIYIIPLGALLAGIAFYWVCGPEFARQEIQKGREATIGGWLEPMTRYVFVGLTLGVYILGIFYGGIG